MNNVLLQPPDRFKHNRRLPNFALKDCDIFLEMFITSWKQLRNTVRILFADTRTLLLSILFLFSHPFILQDIIQFKLKILQVFYPLSHNLSQLNSNQPEYHLPLLQWHIQLLVTKGIIWLFITLEVSANARKLELILRAYCYYFSKKITEAAVFLLVKIGLLLPPALSYP